MRRINGSDEHAEIKNLKRSAAEKFKIIPENGSLVAKLDLDKHTIFPEVTFQIISRRILKAVIKVDIRSKQCAFRFFE